MGVLPQPPASQRREGSGPAATGVLDLELDASNRPTGQGPNRVDPQLRIHWDRVLGPTIFQRTAGVLHLGWGF